MHKVLWVNYLRLVIYFVKYKKVISCVLSSPLTATFHLYADPICLGGGGRFHGREIIGQYRYSCKTY